MKVRDVAKVSSDKSKEIEDKPCEAPSESIWKCDFSSEWFVESKKCVAL